MFKIEPHNILEMQWNSIPYFILMSSTLNLFYIVGTWGTVGTNIAESAICNVDVNVTLIESFCSCQVEENNSLNFNIHINDNH